MSDKILREIIKRAFELADLPELNIDDNEYSSITVRLKEYSDVYTWKFQPDDEIYRLEASVYHRDDHEDWFCLRRPAEYLDTDDRIRVELTLALWLRQKLKQDKYLPYKIIAGNLPPTL